MDFRPTVILVASSGAAVQRLAVAMEGVSVLAVPDADAAARVAAERPVDLVVVPSAASGTVAARFCALSPGIAVVGCDLDDTSAPTPAAFLAQRLGNVVLERRVVALERTARSLEDLAVVGRLTAGILHEVANALDAARRFVRLAAREGLAESERRSALESGLQAVDRTVDVLRTTLAFAKEAAVLEEMRPLGEILDEAVRYAEELRQDSTIRVSVDGRGVGVPGSLLQVFLNLLRNSYRACAGRGEVRLVARCADGCLAVTLEDDGCGFDPALAETLFEPFFRNGASGQGTGLGLTLSRRLVERHHGTLLASSPGPGRGARFTLTLPLTGAAGGG